MTSWPTLDRDRRGVRRDVGPVGEVGVETSPTGFGRAARRGSVCTSVSPMPRPTRINHGPIRGPNRFAIVVTSALARSETVRIPSAARLDAVRRPIPHSASVGRSPMTFIHVSAVSRWIPAGLAKPVAVFARGFVSPIPIEHDRSAADRMRSRIATASASGSSVSAADERLVPAQHLDPDRELAQQRHDAL